MKNNNFDDRHFLLIGFILPNSLLFLKAVICLGLCFGFILLSLTSIVAQTVDERWLYVTNDVRNTRKYFIDKQTLLKDSSPNNPVKTVWAKSLFADGSFQIDKTDWDCKLRRTRILSAGFYHPDGEFIKAYKVEAKWSEIGPDSIGERILQTVCQLAATADDKQNKVNGNSAEKKGGKSGQLIEVIVERANIRVAPSIEARVFAQSNRNEIFVLADLTAVKSEDSPVMTRIKQQSDSSLQEVSPAFVSEIDELYTFLEKTNRRQRKQILEQFLSEAEGKHIKPAESSDIESRQAVVSEQEPVRQPIQSDVRSEPVKPFVPVASTVEEKQNFIQVIRNSRSNNKFEDEVAVEKNMEELKKTLDRESHIESSVKSSGEAMHQKYLQLRRESYEKAWKDGRNSRIARNTKYVMQSIELFAHEQVANAASTPNFKTQPENEKIKQVVGLMKQPVMDWFEDHNQIIGPETGTKNIRAIEFFIDRGLAITDESTFDQYAEKISETYGIEIPELDNDLDRNVWLLGNLPGVGQQLVVENFLDQTGFYSKDLARRMQEIQITTTKRILTETFENKGLTVSKGISLDLDNQIKLYAQTELKQQEQRSSYTNFAYLSKMDEFHSILMNNDNSSKISVIKDVYQNIERHKLEIREVEAKFDFDKYRKLQKEDPNIYDREKREEIANWEQRMEVYLQPVDPDKVIDLSEKPVLKQK